MAPISIIGRSNTTDRSTGFVKIITNHRRVIIGATVYSPNAGEMIHELALAIHMRVTADTIAKLIHAFPTWSESIRIAAGRVK